MPPSVNESSQSFSSISPLDADDIPRSKRISRYILHLNHFLVTSTLSLIVILIECYSGNSIWILYLVPFLTVILIVETLYLFGRTAPKSLQQSHLAPGRLVRRSFIYQASAAFTGIWTENYSWKSYDLYNLLTRLEFLVWLNGVLLFLLALTAQEYNFTDWIEEPSPPLPEANIKDTIRLHNEDNYDLPSHHHDSDSDS